MKFMYLHCIIIVSVAFIELANAITITSGGIKYYISTPLKKNWYQAFRFCQASGMELVDINSHTENTRLLDVIRNPRNDNVAEPRYWTSGTNNGNSNSFYWATTGKPLSFTDWYRVWMQPDNDNGNEHCIEIQGQWDWKWNDANCDTELYFVCREVTKLPLDNCICMEGLNTIQ